jgi:hypothetical protein
MDPFGQRVGFGFRVLFFLSAVSFSPSAGRAEVPDFLWLNTATGSGAEVSYSMAVDDAGNSYIAGYFDSTNVNFGGGVWLTNTTPSISPPYDCFLAKYDSNGVVVWAKRFGGTDDDWVRNVAVDTDRNCYVTGRFVSTNFLIEGITLTNFSPNGNSSFFVAKFSSSGNLLWAKGPDRGYSQSGWKIAVAGSSNCYVVGYFSGTNTIAGTNLISRGSTDVLFLKYDAEGNLLWAQQAGGSYADDGAAVAVDAQGHVYLLANIRSTNAVFGSFTFSVNGTNTDQDMIVAKYDPAGHVVWAKQYGGLDLDYGRSIAVDKLGNCHLTGDYHSTNLVFGTNILTKTSFGFTDIFIAKLNSAGDALWARAAHGYATDSSMEIALDFAGNSYIAGFFQSPTLAFDTLILTNTEEGFLFEDADAFVAKFNPTGDLRWVVQPFGTNDQRAFSVAVDNADNAYITGWTQGTNVLFGDFSATNAYVDIFVAKIEADRPSLQIEKADTNVTIFWPANRLDFNLECSSNLLNWSPVVEPVIITNGCNIVTNSVSAGSGFFRLRKSD